MNKFLGNTQGLIEYLDKQLSEITIVSHTSTSFEVITVLNLQWSALGDIGIGSF